MLQEGVSVTHLGVEYVDALYEYLSGVTFDDFPSCPVPTTFCFSFAPCFVAFSFLATFFLFTCAASELRIRPRRLSVMVGTEDGEVCATSLFASGSSGIIGALLEGAILPTRWFSTAGACELGISCLSALELFNSKDWSAEAMQG